MTDIPADECLPRLTSAFLVCRVPCNNCLNQILPSTVIRQPKTALGRREATSLGSLPSSSAGFSAFPSQPSFLSIQYQFVSPELHWADEVCPGCRFKTKLLNYHSNSGDITKPALRLRTPNQMRLLPCFRNQAVQVCRWWCDSKDHERAGFRSPEKHYNHAARTTSDPTTTLRE